MCNGSKTKVTELLVFWGRVTPTVACVKCPNSVVDLRVKEDLMTIE